jgi:hypothetical protein
MAIASCLVDTNILLRLTRRSDPQHKIIAAIQEAGWGMRRVRRVAHPFKKRKGRPPKCLPDIDDVLPAKKKQILAEPYERYSAFSPQRQSTCHPGGLWSNLYV